MSPMALNLRRWLDYAKTRLDAGLASGNRELDRREADLAARREGRSTMDDDRVVPTFDEVKARIERELERAEGGGAAAPDAVPTPATGPAEPSTAVDAPAAVEPDTTPDAGGPDDDATAAGGGAAPDPEPPAPAADVAAPPAPTSTPAAAAAATPGPAPRSPDRLAADAEAEQVAIEWEARRQRSTERLDDIRKELGIEE